MLKIFLWVSTIASFLLLALLLNLTTPSAAGPFGILVVFILSYTILAGVITGFIYVISRIVEHLSLIFIARKPIGALSLKRSYYFSTVIAMGPIMLIGLQSVGATGFYEVLLVGIFVAIGCLYISKKVS